MQKLAKRFQKAEESIFSRMTRLAQEKNALNLAQGFPDFDGPHELISRIHFHLDNCPNQYTRSAGHLALCQSLHSYSKKFLPRTYDAIDEITVVNGATEGLLCVVLALVDPKKKILVFEPYYESYLACAQMAGADLIGVPLLPPKNNSELDEGLWQIDWDVFDKALKEDVALILLNNPHNPTGKVFNKEELKRILSKAKEKDILVAIDGVYEHLIYPPFQKDFIPFLADFSENIIYISAMSKTLSFTGFKIGWVFAPRALTIGIRAVHQAAVFCQPPHLQLAVADILQNEDFLASYLVSFKEDFLLKRDKTRQILSDFGFRVPNAKGSYFLMAQKHNSPLLATNDQTMALELLDNYGIATIPMSSFYAGQTILHDWLRFAFCKKPETIATLKAALKKPNQKNTPIQKIEITA